MLLTGVVPIINKKYEFIGALVYHYIAENFHWEKFFCQFHHLLLANFIHNFLSCVDLCTEDINHGNLYCIGKIHSTKQVKGAGLCDFFFVQ